MQWFCGACRNKINSNQEEVWWAASVEPDNCMCGFSLTPERSYVFWHQSGGSLFLLWYVCAHVGAQSCFANGKPATIESKHFLPFCIFSAWGCHVQRHPASPTQTHTCTHTRAKPHVRKTCSSSGGADESIPLNWMFSAVRRNSTRHGALILFSLISRVCCLFFSPLRPHKSLLKLVDAVLMRLKARDCVTLINNYREFFDLLPPMRRIWISHELTRHKCTQIILDHTCDCSVPQWWAPAVEKTQCVKVIDTKTS